MKKNSLRPVLLFVPVSLLWLAVLVTAVAVVAAATTASSSTAETTANSPSSAAGMTKDNREGDDDDVDGGGVMDSMIPLKALQLYNTVAGYMEYLYDIVIAPITGNFFFTL